MLRRALLWLSIAAPAASFGVYCGRALLASLNDPVPAVLSALHAHADPARPPVRPSRRVVVALLDGLGEDALEARLREGALGEIAWKAELDSGVPSLSRPVYHAVLTGVPQWVSGIRENSYATGRADSLPDRVRAGGGKVAWMLETVPWFHELFGAPEDVYVHGEDATSVAAFERVWATGPDLLVVHLTGPDHAGHEVGAASAAYVDASRRALQTIAAFRASLRREPGAQEVTWFVGGDHGHMPRGGHGGAEPEVRRVEWVALDDAPGDEPARVGGFPGTAVTSLAPTFARALGVDAPRESMADSLPFRVATLGPPAKASAERVAAVHAARDASAGEGRRPALAVIVALAALVAVVARRRRGLAEAALGLGCVAAFLAAGPALSLSAVRTRPWFLVYAAASMTAGATLAWTFARRRAFAPSPEVSVVLCAAWPFVGAVLTSGSLGRAEATPVETVLLPSLGLVPLAAALAIAVVEVLAWVTVRKPDIAT